MFLGFGHYYGGFGHSFGSYGFGYSSGYNYGFGSRYRHGYWSGDDYGFFGHWPYSSGYFGTRSYWGWNHRHHHYHYGSYCPNVHGGSNYSSAGYYSNGGSDTLAGVLLGGIVGGIIGAEIDGGYNRGAGAAIGAIVGASIGASAASDDRSYGSVQYADEDRYDGDYDSNGRHRYENETYSPPREIRTCLRYETVRGNYICTKWSVEYIYDDEDDGSD
ncbi:MAG: hypothetical protein JKY60_16510 [Kordiimonadaceae bacterium]|nr:hypothetical protein [Kordiimonadaceae bacterium]